MPLALNPSKTNSLVKKDLGSKVNVCGCFRYEFLIVRCFKRSSISSIGVNRKFSICLRIKRLHMSKDLNSSGIYLNSLGFFLIKALIKRSVSNSFGTNSKNGFGVFDCLITLFTKDLLIKCLGTNARRLSFRLRASLHNSSVLKSLGINCKAAGY